MFDDTVTKTLHGGTVYEYGEDGNPVYDDDGNQTYHSRLTPYEGDDGKTYYKKGSETGYVKDDDDDDDLLESTTYIKTTSGVRDVLASPLRPSSSRHRPRL